MTPWSKPVTRLTQVLVKDGGRPLQLVVTLEGKSLSLRLHGRRQSETIDLESAYFGAIRARQQQAKRVKLLAAKEKKERTAAGRALREMSARAMKKARAAA